jgi:hypothetical protein
MSSGVDGATTVDLNTAYGRVALGRAVMEGAASRSRGAGLPRQRVCA